MTLPWFCDFGSVLADPDSCDCRQDDMDDFDWTFWTRDTPTAGTGPPQSGFGTQGWSNVSSKILNLEMILYTCTMYMYV